MYEQCSSDSVLNSHSSVNEIQNLNKLLASLGKSHVKNKIQLIKSRHISSDSTVKKSSDNNQAAGTKFNQYKETQPFKRNASSFLAENNVVHDKANEKETFSFERCLKSLSSCCNNDNLESIDDRKFFNKQILDSSKKKTVNLEKNDEPCKDTPKFLTYTPSHIEDHIHSKVIDLDLLLQINPDPIMRSIYRVYKCQNDR